MPTDAPPAAGAGNLEFLVMADLSRISAALGGRFFPAHGGAEPFRAALARQWDDLRPLLGRLAGRLDEARLQGRL